VAAWIRIVWETNNRIADTKEAKIHGRGRRVLRWSQTTGTGLQFRPSGWYGKYTAGTSLVTMITSKQRVMAAVNHRLTNRTPITFNAQQEVYSALHEHLGTEAKEELFDRLNIDTWMILPKSFVYSEQEKDKIEKTALWGYKTRATPYSGGTYDEHFFSPLADKNEIEDIKKHSWPSDDALEFFHFVKEAQAHKDRAVIGVFTWGSFFIASFVRSMEDLLIDFAVRKTYASHLMKTITERVLAFLDNMLEDHGEGIDIIYMADDYCSQQEPLFRPSVFKKFIVPYLTRIVEEVHKHDKTFLLHCCGAVRPLLPMITDAAAEPAFFADLVAARAEHQAQVSDRLLTPTENAVAVFEEFVRPDKETLETT